MSKLLDEAEAERSRDHFWNAYKDLAVVANDTRQPADYAYLGDFSATPPQYSRHMSCDVCKVSWTGCWDNFECPRCGQGELPTAQVSP